MTNKLEQLKKKMEEAEIAYNAAYAAYDAVGDIAALNAAVAAALNESRARSAYYQELKKEEASND